jgi:excisionase family DNA binding protein
MERLLLTAADVAGLLCVSRSKVYELMYAGQLPSVKIGACRRVRRDAVDAYLAALAETP